MTAINTTIRKANVFMVDALWVTYLLWVAADYEPPNWPATLLNVVWAFVPTA